MTLTAPGSPLRSEERDDPIPGNGEIRVRVSACGVCRTDLHVMDAELPDIKYPIVPGHEIVGFVDFIGTNVTTHQVGDRVGIPWLGYTCGVCRFCREGMENLCDRPLFTGYTRDGGFATHTIADARYAVSVGESGDDVSVAPLLCAGLIGWRSLVLAGNAESLGIYGFGAAGHHFLLPEFSITENVALPMRALSRLSPRAAMIRAEELLAAFGLGNHRHKTPDQLSGGQRQRVAVARALANDPPVILADEPTGSLDTLATSQVFEILRDLVTLRGKTVVAVTHDLNLASQMQRRVHVVDGRLGKDQPFASTASAQ
jgi:ABC-type taurine transport system ATPase subunit